MPAGDWSFRWAATDGTQYDIPCIDERKISFKLNQAGSCELKVPLRSDLGRYIATGVGWGYILAYKGTTLRMVLETVSTDVGPASSEGIPSIAIVGTESAYQRAAGVILSPTAPYRFPTATGQIGTALKSLINANPSWGIRDAVSLATTSSVDPSLFEQGISLLSLIQAWAFRGSGFDFRFDPYFAVDSSFQQVGRFEAATVIGLTKPSAVFEFGSDTRANLTSYSWKRLGGEHLANAIYVPSNGTSAGNTAGTVAAADVPALATYGFRGAWVTADFEDSALRTTLAQEHLLYRKAPRRVLSITPYPDMGAGNVPAPLVDYGIGDIVPVKITDDGVNIVNGNVRVYGLDFTIDKDGKESVEIQTSPETA